MESIAQPSMTEQIDRLEARLADTRQEVVGLLQEIADLVERGAGDPELPGRLREATRAVTA